MKGQKILQFTLKSGYNIKLIDFKMLVNSPLSRLPYIFGFKETTKGIFPYKFNAIENYNFSGKLLSPLDKDYDYKTDYYCYNNKSKKQKQDMLEGLKENYFEMLKKEYEYDKMSPEKQIWFNEVPKDFCLADRIYVYCSSDTNILRKAAIAFEKLVSSIPRLSDVRALEYATAASLVQAVLQI